MSASTRFLLAGLVLGSGISGCVGSSSPTACQIGDTLYPGGMVNPDSACQACDPSVDPAGWSQRSGVDCDAGQLPDAGPPDAGPATECTIGGAEYADGADDPLESCRSCQLSVSSNTWTDRVAGSPCGNGGLCWNGSCVEGCFVDGQVLAAGATDGDGGCQVCLPSQSQTSWSHQPDGTQCGTPGSLAICYSGSCQAGCLIAGTLVIPGQLNPQDACQSCQPLASDSNWSNLAAGSGCGGANVCDGNGTCTGPGVGGAIYFGPPILVGTEGSSWQLASADPNGDGLPDLVDFTWGGVLVLNGLPDGGFDSPVRYLDGEAIVGGTIRDLNQDGIPDMVALGGDNILLEFLWGGVGGTFSKAASTYDIVNGSAVQAIDLQERGIPDLVVCALDGLEVFTNDGSGNFTRGTSLQDVPCYDLQVGNLTGRGPFDLVSAGRESTTVLLNQGTGTFSTSTIMVSGALGVADFDRNGTQDLAVVDPNGLHLFSNQGDGTLTAGNVTLLDFTQAYPRSVAVADLNGDGWPDLVIAATDNCDPPEAGYLYALLNEGAGDGGFSLIDLQRGGLTRPETAVIVSFPGALPIVGSSDLCTGQMTLVPELSH